MEHGVIHHFTDSQEPELTGPRRLEWVQSHMRDCMFGSDEIVVAAEPTKNGVPQKPGIYFLVWDDLITYVGQSVNIYARIVEHVKQKRCIDKVASITGIPKWWQSEIEHAYIHAFDTPWNNERKRSGNLPWMPEMLDLAAGLDASHVMPKYLPVVEPLSIEQTYPQWKMQILGRVQSMGYKGLAF